MTPAPPVTTPSPAAAPPRAVFDDLDEETRVLENMAGVLGDPASLMHLAAASGEAPVDGDEPTPTDGNAALAATAPDATMPMDQSTSPDLPVPRLMTVPALRVAVFTAGVPGEVRLVPLDGAADPPPGAAVAMLVPLTHADSDEVTRLFGFYA